MCLLIMTALLRAQTAPPVDPAAIPTFEQLQAQFKAGNYAEVLRGISRCLALKGEPAKAYDRYDLLMLRGETLVQTKVMSSAGVAYAQAAKSTDDAKKKADARAMELLVQKSTPAGYVPRTTPKDDKNDPGSAAAPGINPSSSVGQPIPFTDKSGRHLALSALFEDDLARVQPRCEAAARQDSIPPIIEALKSLVDLHDIETAASGSDKRTHALSADLTGHAHKLFSSTLKSMSRREDAIWSSARKRRHDSRATAAASCAPENPSTSVEANAAASA